MGANFRHPVPPFSASPERICGMLYSATLEGVKGYSRLRDGVVRSSVGKGLRGGNQIEMPSIGATGPTPGYSG